MSTFAAHHAALLAEYRSLSDEASVLSGVVGEQLTSDVVPLAPEEDADLTRLAEVRKRLGELDKVFDALGRRGAVDAAWNP